MRSLERVRPVFHSELDFHLQFAWLIKQTYPTSCVVPVYKPQQGVREYLDIFVDLRSSALMVELKYKTETPDPPLPDFDLTSQSAHPEGRYLAWKDVQRLERWVTDATVPTTGYAVFLTNDSGYWTDTRPSKYDSDFRIHDGRIALGELNWPSIPQWLPKRLSKPLTLNGTYTCTWHDYADLSKSYGRGTRRKFRYLATRVNV